MSWIRVKHATKTYGKNVVLKDVNFRLGQGDRVGIIGANGTGKTTLLKLIVGLEEPDSGDVEVTDGIKLGYFSQFSELSGEQSVLEVLDAQFSEVHTTERALADIADALAEPLDEPEMTRLLEEQADLFERMEQLDGWNYEHKIDTVLSKLGFNEEHRLLPIDQLSGGWRNRAALAKMLLEAPDVLLMDEPTNYLDVDGLRWLEGWFQNFAGALLVVSHDRDFLDAVVTRIIEVENFTLQSYDGNYSEYLPARHFRLKTLEKQFIHEQELLAFEQEAIKDRREAQKARSKSLDRKLSNIKKSKAPRPVDQIVTGIYEQMHVSKELCSVTGLAKTYGEDRLFSEVSFDVQRRDRIAILGRNGCGKSTLLRVLTGETEPDAGRVQWRKGAQFISYNQVFEQLDLDDTLSHAVNSSQGSLAFTATKKAVNRFLTLFQFSEMDLKQRLGDLSGGQRARVALVMCLLSGASVIILDEPTNHLDIGSAQVMERALIQFPGAILAVSHDRFFIDKIATRVLTFDGTGEVTQSPGLLAP